MWPVSEGQWVWSVSEGLMGVASECGVVMLPQGSWVWPVNEG